MGVFCVFAKSNPAGFCSKSLQLNKVSLVIIPFMNLGSQEIFPVGELKIIFLTISVSILYINTILL
jgi:hypothetical protein